MKILKSLLICLVSTLLFTYIFAFTGCNGNKRGENYNFITTLNSSKVSEYYASGSTINTSNQGGITMVLKDEYTKTGFNWNLWTYKFNTSTEYAIKLTNLTISGFSPTTPNNATLELYWLDNSYGNFRYYNKNTLTFGGKNYYDSYLFLNSFTYDSYEIRFKFTHEGINSAVNKSLYFNFTGIEPNGTVSIEKVSLYEIA